MLRFILLLAVALSAFLGFFFLLSGSHLIPLICFVTGFSSIFVYEYLERIHSQRLVDAKFDAASYIIRNHKASSDSRSATQSFYLDENSPFK